MRTTSAEHPGSGHPSPDLLGRFSRGDLSGVEMRPVLRHLMVGCVACRSAVSGLWRMSPATSGRSEAAKAEERMPPTTAGESGRGVETSGNAARDEYDQVIDRVFRRIVQAEAQAARQEVEAADLCAELLRHPPARQRLLVTNSPRFRSAALCEHLLEKSHEAGFEDPARAVVLARLAIVVADLIAGEPIPHREPHGLNAGRHLQARSWAQLGNSLRISSDLAAADLAFESANALLPEDGDRAGLLDRARVLDLEASLRREQGRYAEAFRLYDRVVAIYQKLGQWHLLGRTLAQKSMVCDEVNDLEGEMRLLRRALDLIDPQEEPRMFLAARHNLILALNATGRHREAFALLFHTRPLYLQGGERMNLLRLRWLEGSVALGLERLEQAEVAFREVRRAFIEQGLSYDVALVSLDLASVYAQQGRSGDMRRLAEEMLAIFQSRSIHREAVAALLIFHRAAEMEQAGVGLVREIATFLKRARNNPELHFSRPS